MKIIKHIIFSLIIFSAINAESQNYTWQAELPPIEATGFYKIFLPPNINAKLQRHSPDIRIFNSENQEVPFLYQANEIHNNNDSIIPLKISSKRHKLIKSYTKITIENKAELDIDNFVFIIDNNVFRKWIKIAAYNNTPNKKYIIKDNFPAQIEYSDTTQTELIINNLPASNFKFYEITFYDYNNQKVKVHKAYTIKQPETKQNYIELPAPKITHKDTLNRTYVNISFPEAQYVDRLLFDIKGPELFFRNAVLSKPGKRTEREGKLYYDELNKNITLNSETENIIKLSHFKIKNLKIKIDNKNSQALRIKKVMAWQQKTYLTTYLKANQKYYLKFGNPKAKFPIYDIEHFKHKIPKDITILTPTNITKINNQRPKLFTSKIWNIPVKYLWSIIGVLCTILLLITTKMIIQQHKKNQN